MTLEELQKRTLDVIRQTRKQLHRLPHEGGMSDNEFIDKVLNSLANDIKQDRVMLKMLRDNEQQANAALHKKADND